MTVPQAVKTNRIPPISQVLCERRESGSLNLKVFAFPYLAAPESTRSKSHLEAGS